MTGKLEREIREALGTVPSFFERTPEAVVEQEWGTYKAFELEDTALPMRTKELIGLAVAAALQCPYCTYFHESAARLNGASDEEVGEAIFMAKQTAGWSTFLRGTNQPLEEFRREVDGVVAHVAAQAGVPAPPTPGTR